MSQHLRVLKEAGLLLERRDATRRLYRTRDEELERLLAQLGAFWDEALGRLGHEAEAEQGFREKRGR